MKYLFCHEGLLFCNVINKGGITMRKLWVMLLVIFSVFFIAGCGDAVSSLTGGGNKGNVLTDPGYANKLFDELKNRDELKGHDLKAMSGITVDNRKELGNIIMIQIQKPGTTDKVDGYRYQNGKWSGPEPVQLTGDGDLADNVGSISAIDFNKIPDMYKIAQEKAKSIEGGEVKYGITYQFSIENAVFTASITVDGAREKYNLTFDAQGNLIKETKF